MSHVISAQPSATSPYQPTAMQEGNGAGNQPRIHRIDSEQHDGCCIHTRDRKGCCWLICRPLELCCKVLSSCTESCCDACTDCLADCCEDKPTERSQRFYNKSYKNSSGYYDYDNANNDDWGISSLSTQHMHVGIANHSSEPTQDLISNQYDDHNTSSHHTSCHDTGTHHSSHHDSGVHHSSSHDSGTHHSSSHHDSGTHDSGGGGCDSGGCDD